MFHYDKNLSDIIIDYSGIDRQCL